MRLKNPYLPLDVPNPSMMQGGSSSINMMKVEGHDDDDGDDDDRDYDVDDDDDDDDDYDDDYIDNAGTDSM